ncbi:hypothetical protein NL676_012372 [Syzygium grande]|nr:hypothetical protein NL676_012372 [Syzygium grande]
MAASPRSGRGRPGFAMAARSTSFAQITGGDEAARPPPDLGKADPGVDPWPMRPARWPWRRVDLTIALLAAARSTSGHGQAARPAPS